MSNENTMPTPAPAKAPASAPTKAPAKSEADNFTMEDVGVEALGHITILYGQPGTGKTTLAAMLPGKIAFLDLEHSVSKLKESWDELGIGGNVKIVKGVSDFRSLCKCLQSKVFDGFDHIVIDSLSVAQEWAKEYTYAHSPTKAKTRATCLDDYEYSTGPMYVYRWFIPNFWNAIAAHQRAGRNVMIIAHANFDTVPNGDSTEFKMFDFDALAMKSGKDSIRNFMTNNSDHILMLKADVAGDKKKNAVGGDTKTLYASPLPYINAKSRTRHDPQFTITPGETFDWTQIIH